MKIIVAEDESEILAIYKTCLESRRKRNQSKSIRNNDNVTKSDLKLNKVFT